MLPELGYIGTLLALGFVLMGLFIKTYVSKKAENLANRNDLIELNSKIEDIKKQNSVTLSIVNANLSVASKGIESFDSEQFKAYIAFHQSCSYILNDLAILDSNSAYFYFISTDFLNKQASLLMESIPPLRKTKATHDLFNDNEIVKLKADELYQKCFQYSKKLELKLGSMAIIGATGKDLQKTIMNLKSNNQSPDSELLQLEAENLKDIRRTRQEAVDYIDGEEYKEAYKYLKDYEQLLREHLKLNRLKIINQ